MSYVLKFEGHFIGAVQPKIKFVLYREEMAMNCIFESTAAAAGASQLLRCFKGYEEAVFPVVDFEKMPTKYADLKVSARKTGTFERKMATQVCHGCGICMSSVENLIIKAPTHIGSSTVVLCIFCCIKLGETAEDMAKEIPESLKNEYFACLVERGVENLAAPIKIDPNGVPL